MSQRSTNVLLQDMLESIEAIQQYTQGLTLDEFRQQKLVQDAVIRRFEILGEAARNVPSDWKHCIQKPRGARLLTCVTA